MQNDLLQRAFEDLKSEGFRMTTTRKNLVKAILSLKGHWTIQEIASNFQQTLPGVGIATIYRTVHLLAARQFLTETHVGPGAARYEVAPKHHHDHLTCRQCGKIFEFENDKVEHLQAEIAEKLGFRLADHRMELYGDCTRRQCPHKKALSKSSKT